MKKESVLSRNELFIASSIIAAHANSGSAAFRQRDVKFLIELFANWVENSLTEPTLNICNTHIQRYLDTLVQQGHAKRQLKAKKPFYRLTRLGLLELLSRMAAAAANVPAEHFFFLAYFLFNYRPIILRLIEAEGPQFPYALRLEVAALLDFENLVTIHMQRCELELKKLEGKIAESPNTSRIAKRLYAEGNDPAAIAAEMNRRHPFSLNSRKPLSELISEIPPDIAKWELEEGNLKRSEFIWQPAYTLLKTRIDLLKKLSIAYARNK